MEMMDKGSVSVDDYVAGLPAWQRDNLVLFREHILAADDSITETIKWGVPTFIKGKTLLFAMSAFKAHTKYNSILNGARLNDSKRLFNNGLESKKSRSIDLREGERVDAAALTELIRASIMLSE